MAWDPNEKGNPAWLTKQASKHGGVDNFIDDIHNEGYQEGHDKGVIEGAELATILIGVVFATCKGIKHIVQKRKENKKAIQQQSQSAKNALRQMCEDTAYDMTSEEFPDDETI